MAHSELGNVSVAFHVSCSRSKRVPQFVGRGFAVHGDWCSLEGGGECFLEVYPGAVVVSHVKGDP